MHPEQAQERWRGGRSILAHRRWYQWPHLSHRTPFISIQSVLGGITTEQAIHIGMSECGSGNTFGTSSKIWLEISPSGAAGAMYKVYRDQDL